MCICVAHFWLSFQTIRPVYVSLHAPPTTRAAPIHRQFDSHWMITGVCVCVCVFVVVYTQLACVPTSGCVHIRVCVCYVFFWCAYVVAKWTSVNKLCADCIYLIHMLVDCTAVLRSCCVWEEKSLCSRSLVCGAGITAMSAWIWLLILTKSCAVMGSFFHFFFFIAKQSVLLILEKSLNHVLVTGDRHLLEVHMGALCIAVANWSNFQPSFIAPDIIGGV